MQTAPAHPITDQRAFVLGHCPPQLQPELTVRIFGHLGLVDEDYADPPALEFFQHHLLHAKVAGQAGRF